MHMCFVITFWLSTIYACGHVDTANLFSSGIEGLFYKDITVNVSNSKKRIIE